MPGGTRAKSSKRRDSRPILTPGSRRILTRIISRQFRRRGGFFFSHRLLKSHHSFFPHRNKITFLADIWQTRNNILSVCDRILYFLPRVIYLSRHSSYFLFTLFTRHTRFTTGKFSPEKQFRIVWIQNGRQRQNVKVWFWNILCQSSHLNCRLLDRFRSFRPAYIFSRLQKICHLL